MKSYKELSIKSKNKIVEEINNNILSYKEILKKYNISQTSYKKIREEYKLPRRDLGKKRFYNIDDNYFETIDTEHKAYWLGFLYADGCISKSGNYHTVIIALSRIDKTHLKLFLKDIKSNYKIKERKNNTNSLYCRVECCSKKMFEDLIKLGCVEKKTFILKFPTENQVPKNLINHFMRGYFDGDGTINSHKEIGNKKNQIRFQVLGTKDFLKGYINNLPIENKDDVTLQKTKSTYTIQLGGNVQSKKIFDFLYKDSTIYLERKHEKYIQFFYK